MSTCSSSGSSYVLEDEELLQFEARCKELKIEKDMLKQSSVELIRSLESHSKTLSETRSNDKKRIQDLERELRNCSQELDYLQDQLTTRDTQINRLTDYIHSLESKVKAKEDLDETIKKLERELKARKSENFDLLTKLADKEHKLRNSTLHIDNLEETISNIALDFQCDIESMKLDLMATERGFLEAKELQKEYEAQMREYEVVVKRLTEQLKDEKLKANEEAEDLGQEMAELRYQLTGLLEEEYKKRACIEQRALQRITELESQIEKERRKTFGDLRGLPNA